MKKTLLLIITFGLSITSKAQDTNTFPPNGSAGIGTLTPGAWFGSKVLELKDYRPVIRLSPTTVDGIGTIMFKGAYNIQGGTPDEFHLNYISSQTQPRIIIGAYQSAGKIIFSIMGNGNVGVGVEFPTEKLAVNGLIRAKEVKVETLNWPDYVFQPTFRLTPLAEVEQYITKNGHLPEIPSAAQIENEGLKLGEMNKLLLKKVEELTLYLIEKDKNDMKQQNEINELKKRLDRVVEAKKD